MLTSKYYVTDVLKPVIVGDNLAQLETHFNRKLQTGGVEFEKPGHIQGRDPMKLHYGNSRIVYGV